MIEKAPHYIFPNITRAMSTLFMFTVFFTIHVTDLMNETTFFFLDTKIHKFSSIRLRHYIIYLVRVLLFVIVYK